MTDSPTSSWKRFCMTDRPLRVVVDTNVLLSFLIKRNSVPGVVVQHVLEHHRLLISSPVIEELASKCRKGKFRSYFTLEEGAEFVELLERVGGLVPIRTGVVACRDAKDNMFLDLALSGRADLLISGDKDLSDMKGLGGTAILPPKQCMRLLVPGS